MEQQRCLSRLPSWRNKVWREKKKSSGSTPTGYWRLESTCIPASPLHRKQASARPGVCVRACVCERARALQLNPNNFYTQPIFFFSFFFLRNCRYLCFTFRYLYRQSLLQRSTIARKRPLRTPSSPSPTPLPHLTPFTSFFWSGGGRDFTSHHITSEAD